MATSVIIREDKAGRCSIHRPARGNPAYTDERAALAEASRARFRDDHAYYCVHTGFFHDLAEATLFCSMRNKGASIERAMKAVRARRNKPQ